ncbi:MAG: diphthine synthase [Candidatus Pacearchaeota archaeon]
MVFYIIGLGLNVRGISLHGKKVLKNVKKIYLEKYTIDLPYTKKDLEKELKIKIVESSREFIESEKIVEIAKKEDIVLLVYGSPLSATTHISLINLCRDKKVKYKILYAGSIFDAVAESGLSLYKFGKTTNLPKWQKNFEPKSFIEIIKKNIEINAHTLLLIDIGLEFKDAKKQLKEAGLNERVILCTKLGIKSKFYYDYLDKINQEEVKLPYCIIIPAKLENYEEESLMRACK